MTNIIVGCQRFCVLADISNCCVLFNQVDSTMWEILIPINPDANQEVVQQLVYDAFAQLGRNFTITVSADEGAYHVNVPSLMTCAPEALHAKRQTYCFDIRLVTLLHLSKAHVPCVVLQTTRSGFLLAPIQALLAHSRLLGEKSCCVLRANISQEK